ncbi:MAG: DUF1989 domain-containing protein [Pseudomonadota bacterium]
MKLSSPRYPAPADAEARLGIVPVTCYPPETLPPPDRAPLAAGTEKVAEIKVPPRDARCIEVPAGAYFRILSVEGSQVGDLNLWAKDDLSERFYSGKTRALHGTHLSTGDRMWSSFPAMRPMATITDDTLDWYGFDSFGGSVHDVIGTRCDPYTGRLLSGDDYHYCCHSNLTRALADHTGLTLHEAETHVHDVLNVFMCTGFDRQTGQYFMKASPVRPGDYLELFAEIDLIVGLSACPGGDCSTEHSSDTAQCHPLLIEVYRTDATHTAPAKNQYDRTHGL